MEILEYSDCKEKDNFLNQIQSCEWRAAKYLASLVSENRLADALGGSAKLFLLAEGDTLVSFVTASAQDCIADPALTPWLGFFHTAPEYRGNGYGKILLDRVCEMLRADGFNRVYIATDHIGLYEKYGFTYLENRADVWGADSRIYKKDL